ncbi:DUF4422 domain-containing protein [Adlercreutzia murintestinalis]|jgi:Lipopolysaccharide biosynthesis proteins, LPS:glycosyltransferases|uniref:DUF4422 domain-containing protein n=1 Tax=Adlercreutzia murintestinalis TaxID=2941325 RepID=UPI00203EA9F5|nr:DUF4422 domain-containing protein [Adlercreutzia murintestinalis]
MTNLKVFITHSPNSDNYLIERPYVTNVTAGACFQDEPACASMQPDNVGDNISERNPSFCELTTLYWAWKNVQADYYSFCHYRRLLSFAPHSLKNTLERDWGVYTMNCLTERNLQEIGWGDAHPELDVADYDFMIGEHIKTQDLQASNVRDHWRNADALYEKDLDLFLEIIAEKYPDLAKIARDYVAGDDFYPCNMFVARKELFDEYCTKLFDVLFEFEHRADFSHYSIEATRVTGHLAERFTGIFYRLLQTRHQLRLRELEVVRFEKTAPLVQLAPTSEDAKGVVFAANNAYAPYLGTCLKSLCENLDPQMPCDIAIFNTDFSADSKARFCEIAAPYPCINVRFVDVTPWVDGYSPKVEGIIDHVSVETFYRFLILEVMAAYDQVLYLDSDMIIDHDIFPLLTTALNNDLIGAVIDADYLAQLNNFDMIDGDSKESSRRIYSEGVLGLADPFSYFQAGVLLLNIQALREVISLEDLMRMASSDQYIYMDQDILNVVCQGRVQFLDMRWNVMMDHHNGEGRGNLIKRFTPAEISKGYFESRKDPFIIHYAGSEKPWVNPECDYAAVFWRYARTTSFYEIIINRMAKRKPTVAPHRSFASRVKGRIRRTLRK